MWDERYDTETFVYGREPNDFLVENAGLIPGGRVLCLAEGEGRNAAYLARLGHEVVAVDSSAVGLDKAKRLAAEANVAIETVVADLADYAITDSSFAGIVSIFCHLPQVTRAALHERCLRGLTPGGLFILEGFTPRQLALATGGPKSLALLMEPDVIRQELPGLQFEVFRETERPVTEGKYHGGTAAVVQILASKGLK